MSHKYSSLLRTIFQDPVSSNIHWREVESLLHHLGAAVEPTHGARFHVKLNRVECVLHHPHHGNVCDKQTIKLLREFLGHAGIGVSSYEKLSEQ
ncbi:MAG: type II toxin-antitoxin system HicA family toxin [Sterolibacterium sp.]